MMAWTINRYRRKKKNMTTVMHRQMASIVGFGFLDLDIEKSR